MTQNSLYPRKYLLAVIGAVVILAALIWLGIAAFNKQEAKGVGNSYSLSYKTSDGTDDIFATSSPGSLTSFTPGTTGTTTMLTLNMEGVTEASINVQVAMAMGSQVHLSCQYADGPPNVNTARLTWFDGDCPFINVGDVINVRSLPLVGTTSPFQVAHALPYGSSTIAIGHEMWGSGPNHIATTTRHIDLIRVTSSWLRISAQMIGTSAPGNVRIYATLKSQVP